MARVYYPRKTSTRILEGVVAGLLAGVVVVLFMVIADLFIGGGAWWATPAILGSLVTGTPQLNASELNSAYPIGLVIHFLLYAALGVGFIYYVPIFRRLKISLSLGGAIYGAIIWLFIYIILLNSIKPGLLAELDEIALLVANVHAGAFMGWWLKRQSATPPVLAS